MAGPCVECQEMVTIDPNYNTEVVRKTRELTLSVLISVRLQSRKCSLALTMTNLSGTEYHIGECHLGGNRTVASD